jgi:predicted enzyme related to lactoylglutathione lyase
MSSNKPDTSRAKPRLAGFEIYFDDLEAAIRFYTKLGLQLCEEKPGHHAKFGSEDEFLCLERKGSEPYPSRDKAVVFLEVFDLQSMIEKIGRDQFLQIETKASGQYPPWAVLHDPEGHNVVIVEGRGRTGGPV